MRQSKAKIFVLVALLQFGTAMQTFAQTGALHGVDRYGGSFYSNSRTAGISAGTLSSTPGVNNGIGGLNFTGARSTNSFTAPGIPAPGTNFGINSMGGPRLGGSSLIGGPAHIIPNGVGAPGASGHPVPFLTPYGNGANGPMGTYGGNSFGSSGGGSVR